MKKNIEKILVTSIAFSKNEFLKKKMASSFKEVIFNENGNRYSKNELVALLKKVDGAIIGLDKIDKDILKEVPNLKFIAKYGVGLDNIDLLACKKYGVKIGWTGGVNRISVAEMVLGYMIGLSRNLYPASLQMKKGVWNKSGGFELSGKTIGIIGVGYIGKEVVRVLKPFNCKILVNDVIEQSVYYKDNNLKEVSKEVIFTQSDIVTIHTPLTQETKYLINKNTLALMKSTAYIINSARGGIVNQNELKQALKDGVIAGAAIDAYEVEPPEDKEFLELENLFCTPHIGGNSKEAVLAMGESAIRHISDFFNNSQKERDESN